MMTPTSESARTYLIQIQQEFSDKPQIFDDFLKILQDFNDLKIDIQGVIHRVSTLFHEKKSLLVDFNMFLPVGYTIEVSQDGTSVYYQTPNQPGVKYCIVILPLPPNDENTEKGVADMMRNDTPKTSNKSNSIDTNMKDD